MAQLLVTCERLRGLLLPQVEAAGRVPTAAPLVLDAGLRRSLYSPECSGSRSGGAGWTARRCLPQWDFLPRTPSLFLEHTPRFPSLISVKSSLWAEGQSGAVESFLQGPSEGAGGLHFPHTRPFFNHALESHSGLALRPESCVYTEEKSQAPGLCVPEAWGGSKAFAESPAILWP